MFSATHFTYDGVFSGIYGLTIADFDENSVIETTAFSPVLNLAKPTSLNRAFHNGVSYEEMPTHQFSIVSQAEIPDIVRREILSWLIGRREFKRLQIHQPDLEGYYYNCVFTSTDIIYVNGRCHGFRITANFDSPYAYGQATTVSVGEAGEHEVTIYNNSDIMDDYVYPIVEFTGGSVKIVNLTDDTQRAFEFSDLTETEVVTVDNEIRYISSTVAGEKLSNFKSKNWLRLRPGKNRLSITCAGSKPAKKNYIVKITCPCYAMIGF